MVFVLRYPFFKSPTWYLRSINFAFPMVPPQFSRDPSATDQDIMVFPLPNQLATIYNRKHFYLSLGVIQHLHY